jgi:hypothetical protein
MRIAYTEQGDAKRNQREPKRKRKPVAAPAKRNQHARRKAPRKLSAKLSGKKEPGLFVAQRPAADKNRQNRPKQHGNNPSGRKRGMDYYVRSAVMRGGIPGSAFKFRVPVSCCDWPVRRIQDHWCRCN